jgi:hypothetical protein
MHSPEGGGLSWFYVREGRRVGPFDKAPFIAELLTLDAPEAVLVWRTGLPAWTKAGHLDELRRELPPPVPGSGPEGLQETPATDAPNDAGAAEKVPPLPSEAPMSDGDFAGDLGQGGPGGPAGDAGKAEAGQRLKRRRHRHRPSGSLRVPDYVLPLALLILAVMVGLWYLLRRMNEPPPGQILHQGMLAPAGPPGVCDASGSLPGAFRG